MKYLEIKCCSEEECPFHKTSRGHVCSHLETNQKIQEFKDGRTEYGGWSGLNIIYLYKNDIDHFPDFCALKEDIESMR